MAGDYPGSNAMSCDLEGCDETELIPSGERGGKLKGWHAVVFDGGMHRDACDGCFEKLLGQFVSPPPPQSAD